MLQRLGKFSEAMFVFFLLPVSALGNLLAIFGMPTIATKVMYTGWAVPAAILVALGVTNCIVRSTTFEDRISPVMAPLAGLALVSAAACGGLHYFGI